MPVVGDSRGMHFGRFLAKLRSDRGLTQQGLADRSRMSTPSIQRGESAEACPFRRSNATSILHALDSVAPLSQNDRENYLQMAGLEALAKMAADLEARRVAELDDMKARVASSPLGFDTSDDLDLTTAHQYVQRLYEEVGAVRLLSALEGIASTWEIDLPPKLRASDRRRPIWNMVYPPETDASGTTRQVRVAQPVPKQTPPGGNEAGKRRIS